jgi:uncharacterized protein YbbC (DUF1343 family)
VQSRKTCPTHQGKWKKFASDAWERRRRAATITSKNVASLVFLTARNVGDGLRPFLTAIVLENLIGVPLPVCVVIVGLSTIIYTFLWRHQIGHLERLCPICCVRLRRDPGMGDHWNRDGMMQRADERALAPGRRTTMCSVPRRRFLLAMILLMGSRYATGDESPRRLPRVDPSAAGMSAERLGEIENVVREALARDRVPGCVVSVGRHGKLVYLRAFGYRQTRKRWLSTNKEEITVRQLPTHLGGLTPDNALADYADGPAKAWERICGLELGAKPGTEFIYSDVGLIVLGELVRRVSSEGLDQFARQRIFQPLAMTETMFQPNQGLRARAAVTEQRDDRWMQGEVHVFLSNRAHPDGKGSVNSLAGQIGTISAAAVVTAAPTDMVHDAPADGQVLCGIDVLQRDMFRLLTGKRVGLITNHTGVNRDGVTTTRLLFTAPQVELKALFSPEHGMQGTLDVPQIGDSRDDDTGVAIWSLYGETRKPTAASLAGIDTLVFDIQDIGTRFYTYISTLGYAMQAAAEAHLEFVVLDRPNPINGIDVAGPVLDPGRESFVACHAMPVRHGMTVGELATMYRDAWSLSLDLKIVKVEGWRRGDFFDRTGLAWINPSPNMRSLTQALLYPGIGLLETTNLSVGRGTDTPFEVVGAPWVDGRQLAASLNAASVPGARFVPIRFTPTASKFAGEACQGVNVIVVNWAQFDPLRTGLEVARTLRRLHPGQWDAPAYDRLLLDAATWQAVSDGRTTAEIMDVYREELEQFKQRRGKWLLYD